MKLIDAEKVKATLKSSCTSDGCGGFYVTWDDIEADIDAIPAFVPDVEAAVKRSRDLASLISDEVRSILRAAWVDV